MSTILYINGNLLDLEPRSVIAQTKQINELTSIENRKCNHTNIFKVPKTANNIKALQFLTFAGNQSPVPYQKNECSLFSSSGECFIYKGWAQVADDGSNYEVVIYDGIIDLYKAIENKTLSNLDLSELQHQKTVANVIASWIEDLPYRYILADYNGDNGDTSNGTVNIDYQVPSVNVKWLWDRIFEKFEFTYSGTIFETEDFTNLWMTVAVEDNQLIFDADDYSFVTPSNPYFYAQFNSAATNELEDTPENIHMKVSESTTYGITVRGVLFGRGIDGDMKDARVRLCKNSIGENPGDAFINQVTSGGYRVLGEAAENISYGDEFEIQSAPFDLEAGESICIVITRSEDGEGGFQLYESDDNQLDVQLYRVDPNVIDFAEAFKDFSIKDFLNEIVNRFGLTLYADKYSNNYEFRTLHEQLITAPKVDWSDKFANKLKENYIRGAYAQRNWFRYNYNDKEATHNDWYIEVFNVNLPDSKDAVKSKIYSPERLKSTFLNEQTNVYKLWEKEIVEGSDGSPESIKYTPLDKRHYFTKASLQDSLLTVKSKIVIDGSPTNVWYRENYIGLKWDEIIDKYYTPLRQVLDFSQIVTLELYLKDTDVVNFDFRKLYYFEQLSAYFYMNKISNFVTGKTVTCEMVKVHRNLVIEPTVPPIKITKVEIDEYLVVTHFDLTTPADDIVFEYSTDQEFWSQIVFPATSNPYVYALSTPTTWYIRLKAGTDYSNVVSFTLPTNETIIIP